MRKKEENNMFICITIFTSVATWVFRNTVKSFKCVSWQMYFICIKATVAAVISRLRISNIGELMEI